MATQIEIFKLPPEWFVARIKTALLAFRDKVFSTVLNPETEAGFNARLLNGILLAMLGLGGLGEVEWLSRTRTFTSADGMVIGAVLILFIAFLINRRGHTNFAALLTIWVVTAVIFQLFHNAEDQVKSIGILAYLIFPILLGELFFSSRAYFFVSGMMLAAMVVMFPMPEVFDRFTMLSIFTVTMGVFKRYYRQLDDMRMWRLKESHQDVIASYDATIAGWSAALDMRDRDTEGHSQRVTDMTLKLAEMLGIDDEEKIHIYRGALLHDIGKLGVPDAILHKPGPLTEAEWEIMRQHPTMAVDMLSKINYLDCALEIPYCHHERWDGSGYPRGLRGEQIPFSARIFAVVDVWDALTSDRPYRGAWSQGHALQYITEQSGILFDPNVVRAFIMMLMAEGISFGKEEAVFPLQASQLEIPVPVASRR